MAQCGLHVPAAAGARLPVFKRIYADIGDEQSIAASLSTFSAHLAAIVEMTRDLQLPALVLLDEVGAGTDPTEGGALGVAIVDHFRRRGAMLVATTHHGLMKAIRAVDAGRGVGLVRLRPAQLRADLPPVPGRAGPQPRPGDGGAPRPAAVDRARTPGRGATTRRRRRRRCSRSSSARRPTLRRRRRRTEADARGGRVAAWPRSRRPSRRSVAKKRAELEAFARELKRRGEEAVRKAPEAIREAVQQVEAKHRSLEAEGTKARLSAVAAIAAAQEEAPARHRRSRDRGGGGAGAASRRGPARAGEDAERRG